MSDLREAICKRLVEICSTTGATTKRMVTELHQSERPAIVVNDGSESVELNKGGKAPLIVTMRPQLVLIATDSDNPGTAINKLRASVLKAVLTDDTLIGLLHPHGAIKFVSSEVGMERRAETNEVSMALDFEATYRLTPADL